MGEKIAVRQSAKGLFDAEFDILPDAGDQIGRISMKGALGSREGTFQVEYDNRKTILSPAGQHEAAEYVSYEIKRSPFRPYRILWDGLVGMMFHDQIKTGFLKSAGYHFMKFLGREYYLYCVGFGERGICAPVYEGDVQIAEIRKPFMVINDLHSFDIILQQTTDPMPSIILCCYMYVISYYRAGEKTLKGKQKSIVVTKDEYLLSKCRTIL